MSLKKKLKSWWSISEESLTKQKSNRSLRLEPLEQRQVLAASLAAGILTVAGTSGNDDVSVELMPSGASVKVTVNKQIDYFPLAKINEFKISAKNGHDHVEVSPAIKLPGIIDGGKGNDVLRGGSGEETIRGGFGQDLIEGRGGNDRLEGGQGNDLLNGGPGYNNLYGGGGQDKWNVNGTGKNDEVSIDSVKGIGVRKSGGKFAQRDNFRDLDRKSDSIVVDAGKGDDEVKVDGPVSAILLGGFGNDILLGGGGNDLLDGGPGNDKISARSGRDIAYGAAGNDSVNAGPGADVLISSGGNDLMLAGSGTDQIFTSHTSNKQQNLTIVAQGAFQGSGPSFQFAGTSQLTINVKISPVGQVISSSVTGHGSGAGTDLSDFIDCSGGASFKVHSGSASGTLNAMNIKARFDGSGSANCGFTIPFTVSGNLVGTLNLEAGVLNGTFNATSSTGIDATGRWLGAFPIPKLVTQNNSPQTFGAQNLLKLVRDNPVFEHAVRALLANRILNHANNKSLVFLDPNPKDVPPKCTFRTQLMNQIRNMPICPSVGTNKVMDLRVLHMVNRFATEFGTAKDSIRITEIGGAYHSSLSRHKHGLAIDIANKPGTPSWGNTGWNIKTAAGRQQAVIGLLKQNYFPLNNGKDHYELGVGDANDVKNISAALEVAAKKKYSEFNVTRYYASIRGQAAYYLVVVRDPTTMKVVNKFKVHEDLTTLRNGTKIATHIHIGFPRL